MYFNLEFQFNKNTNEIKIEWLCRDENIISFRWSPNDTLTYVYEYSENGDWIYCDKVSKLICF